MLRFCNLPDLQSASGVGCYWRSDLYCNLNKAHLNRDQVESNLSVPGIKGCHENALSELQNEPPLQMSVDYHHQNIYWACLNPDLIQPLALKGCWCHCTDIQSGGSFQSSYRGHSYALETRYTQVGFNLISVHMCSCLPETN